MPRSRIYEPSESKRFYKLCRNAKSTHKNRFYLYSISRHFILSILYILILLGAKYLFPVIPAIISLNAPLLSKINLFYLVKRWYCNDLIIVCMHGIDCSHSPVYYSSFIATFGTPPKHHSVSVCHDRGFLFRIFVPALLMWVFWQKTN